MPIFDRYIAVDWSANNGPKTGKDSIWIGEATASGLQPSRNPATRALAMADIEATLLSARMRGERIMVGFDFVFGFPAGAAEAIARVAAPSTGLSLSLPLVGRGDHAQRGGWGYGTPWELVWSTLFDLVQDSPQNLSNRFDVAAAINRATGPRFWGHPHGRTYDGLAPTRANTDYTAIAERRAVESRIGGPQPVWKLYGNGSVGSQSLLGIPRLETLRRHPVLGRDTAVWPFDTDFERNLVAPITIVEIYPSYFKPSFDVLPVDRDQVETCVTKYSEMDRAGSLGVFLSAPADISADHRRSAVTEEGWIAGVGHEHLKQLPVHVPLRKRVAA